MISGGSFRSRRRSSPPRSETTSDNTRGLPQTTHNTTPCQAGDINGNHTKLGNKRIRVDSMEVNFTVINTHWIRSKYFGICLIKEDNGQPHSKCYPWENGKLDALIKEIFGYFFKTFLFLAKWCGVATYFLY